MVSSSVEVTELRNGGLPEVEEELNGQGDAGHLHARERLETTSSEGGGQHRLMAEDETTPTSPESRDGLRRTSSKIANLRAAFEKHTDDDVATNIASPKGTIGQLERISLRTKDQESELAKRQARHDMELTKMIEDHELELASLKEDHTSTLEKEEELRQAYEEKCTSLEEEIEALQEKLSRQDTQWQLEMERQCNHLHQEKNHAQEEARNLQRQLSELKKGISAATRIEHQISDATFAQEFTKFFHETQNWIVNNFRKIKTDANADVMCARLVRAVESRHLGYLRPIYEHFDSSIKLAAFQATTACYMMEIFDDPLLFGIPSQPQWRNGIKMAIETLPEVLSPVAFNRWRAMTLDTLGQCKGEEMKQAVESASRTMAKRICDALNTLTEADDSEARIVSLDGILKRAVSLAHLFRVQRPRYEFGLPPPGATFDISVMDDVSVESDNWPASKGIRCAVWPYVVKYGDEDGNNMELSNVVVKSRVLCG